MTEIPDVARRLVELDKENTPLIRIVSKDIEFAESQIQEAARFLKKDLIIWTAEEMFRNFFNYSNDRTPLRERIASVLQKIDVKNFRSEHNIVENERIVLESGVMLEPIRGRDPYSYLQNDDDIVSNGEKAENNLRKNHVDTPSEEDETLNYILDTSSEDAVIDFWAYIAQYLNCIMVIEGSFIFLNSSIERVGNHTCPNPLILLSSDELKKEFANVTEYLVSIECEPDVSAFQKTYVEMMKKNNLEVPPENVQKEIAKAMTGCESMEKARRIFFRIIRDEHKLGLEELPLLRDSIQNSIELDGEILSFVNLSEMDTEVGGMEKLMAYIDTQKVLDTPEAEEYGLKSAKGIILIGPPGCGKTLVAHEIAKRFGCRMVRFAPEMILKRYVGESESLMPMVLHTIDCLGKIVVFVDEIEKILSDDLASRSHESTRRIIGSLLQYMSDRKSKAFFIITSNQMGGIPPEFTRAGRFDKVWFIDLPSQKEREKILSISLRKHRHKPFIAAEMEELAKISQGFSGAELDNAVQNALLASFLRDKHLMSSDVKSAILNTVPLSAGRAEEIAEQRRLAKQMGTHASGNDAAFDQEMLKKQEDRYYQFDPSYA